MFEVKSRKKSGPKGAPSEPGKRSDGGKNPEARGGGGGGWADPRTGVSLLSLGTCLGLACVRSLKLSWNSGSLFK
uniref:IKBKB interacting protein n=1 Tax=Felis catus TaxID=9685 RepID=A0ABI7Z587_FELCA